MARNYKELYEKMINSDWFKKAYYNKSLGECPITVEELEESEDERIRKAIIDYLSNELHNVKQLTPRTNEIEAWIAYLEKQKEQKSIDDAIKNVTKNKEAATEFLKSAGIMDDNGELAEMYRSEQKPANVDYISGIRNELLGIEDNAKNIDGLTASQWVAIRAAHRLLGEYLKKLNSEGMKKYTFTDMQESYKRGHLKGEEVGREQMMIEIQRDHDGEEWINPDDFTAHIRQAYQDGFREGVESVKPAEWSEEDKARLESILDEYKSMETEKRNWIKSLPERFSLQPKQEWNDEDEYVINKVLNWAEIVNPTSSIFEKLPKKQFIERLKSLRPQPKQEWSEDDDKMLKSIIEDSQNCHILGVDQIDWIKSLRLQPKQEWSEEDEKFINNLCNLLASLAKNNRIGCYYAPDIINKIKSLRPKPHWKPSEEQMEALNEIINTLAVSKHPHESDYLFNMLKGLRKNLKKL